MCISTDLSRCFKECEDTMKQTKTCEEKYPGIKVGDEIVLISMKDEPQMPEGLHGTVLFFDAVQIHIRWENGSSLALIPEIDKFTVEKSPNEKA